MQMNDMSRGPGEWPHNIITLYHFSTRGGWLHIYCDPVVQKYFCDAKNVDTGERRITELPRWLARFLAWLARRWIGG
jgi:hypothetical protein